MLGRTGRHFGVFGAAGRGVGEESAGAGAAQWSRCEG